MNSFFLSMPDAEYRRAVGLSQSALKEFEVSPARYKASLAEARKATPAMLQGIHFHHLLLTPDDLPRLAVRPEGLDLRTADGKKWKATALAGKEGELAMETHNECMAMVQSVRRHPDAAGAFSGGEPEVSVFKTWQSQHTGRCVLLKGRMDYVHEAASAVVDAKTCEDARPGAFAADAEDRGYFIQGAFYVDYLWNPLMDSLGLPEKKLRWFVLVAVEKRPPYDVMVYQVGPEDRAKYHEYIGRLLERFAECDCTGHWPGYSTGVRVLSPPAHKLQRRLEALEVV